MSKVYSHFSQYPKDKWRWCPYFSPQELASKREGELRIMYYYNSEKENMND